MPFDGQRMIVAGFTPILDEAGTKGGKIGYVDGFLVAVPAGNKQAYLEMAAKAAAVFKEFGAVRVVETWGDERPRRQGHRLQGRGEGHARREDRLFVGRMALQGGARRRLEEDDGRRAHEGSCRCRSTASA